MSQLVDFLLARITEDEAAASDGGDFIWEQRDPPFVGYDTLDRIADCWHGEAFDITPGHPMHRDRVLADAAAKRQLIHAHGRDHCCSAADLEVGVLGEDMFYDHCPVVQILAMAYVAHPGFDPAWALVDH